MENYLIKEFNEYYKDYLKDESRKIGKADSISFPKSEDDVISILKSLCDTKPLITTQGARTGITGGAVPQGGHIINLSKMNRILGLRYDANTDNFFLRVEPGVLLSDLRKTLKSKNFHTDGWDKESILALQRLKESGPYFFSPDPTETTASIGGMVACNSSGACSFKYGPTRNHVEAINVVLANGDKISLKRGVHKAHGHSFSITTSSGKLIEGSIPRYNLPDVKNASGYYSKENMDLIDLFIGSEGTLGIVTEIEIKLLKAPSVIYALNAFFSCEEDALNFVQRIREESSPIALEFFNHNALNLLRMVREKYSGFNKIKELSPDFHTAVYVEFSGDNEDEVMDTLMDAGRIIEECGGDLNNTWASTDSQSRESLKYFRHATPEAVNLLIDEYKKLYPGITKLGTDMAVPDSKLFDVMKLYNNSLTEGNFYSVIFGHIGDNHLHVNIIPRNMDEYYKGKELYAYWSEKIIAMGGSISAEHGVGKMKTNLLKKMFGNEGINEMKTLKNLFDPDYRLNIGNLF